MGKSIVIVGASPNRRKFSNKAVRAFRDGGWTVIPVNPAFDDIEGLRCYRKLSDVPGPVDRVTMYVGPAIGKTMLDDLAVLKPAEVFFNPGSADEDLIAQARLKGLNAIEACSIVNIGLRPDMYPDE